jgi:hypothetical protein
LTENVAVEPSSYQPEPWGLPTGELTLNTDCVKTLLRMRLGVAYA